MGMRCVCQGKSYDGISSFVSGAPMSSSAPRRTLLKPGRYRLEAGPPCGTNGLISCVGLAIKRNQWFIAHIDCGTQLRSRTDEKAQQVSDWVSKRLDDILPKS